MNYNIELLRKLLELLAEQFEPMPGGGYLILDKQEMPVEVCETTIEVLDEVQDFLYGGDADPEE